MKQQSVRTWDELRPLLDFSYCAADGKATVEMFRQQRTEAFQNFSNVYALLPPASHGHVPAWAALPIRCYPDLDVAPIDASSPFETVMFLAALLDKWAANREPDDRQWAALLLLQKRFEVNRRIFSRYDQNIRKEGDEFTDLDPYALLAFALQIGYLETGRFTLLNTAIKLVDLIVISGWSATRPALPQLPLALEKAILDELNTP